ncbi:MAG: aspartate aminotransferase family protein, partial [Flavobacteriales bacterium]|nr:aspartate aminotransferase family protein [Flavobacteriales bacterium]
FYEELETKTSTFTEDVNKFASAQGYPFRIFHVGSIFWVAFTDKDKISASDQIDDDKMSYFKTFHGELLKRGIYIGPSGFEVGFVSRAHSASDLQKGAQEMKAALEIIFG